MQLKESPSQKSMLLSTNNIIDPDATALVSRVDGSPLALYTAGVYLHKSQLSFSQYRYGHGEKSRPSTLQLEPTDTILEATWIHLFNCVQEKNFMAVRIFLMWAYYDHRDIWHELISAGISSPSRNRPVRTDAESVFTAAMEVLCDHGLVEGLANSDGYSCHSCIHDWITRKVKKDPDPQLQQLALFCITSAIPERSVQKYRILQQRLIPHADRYLEFLGDQSLDGDEYSAISLRKLGDLYRDQALLLKAESVYLRALSVAENAWGPNHELTLEIAVVLGHFFNSQGRILEAGLMHVRAFEARNETIGEDHPETLKSMSNLASILRRQDKFELAEYLYQQVFDKRERVLGHDHPDTLESEHSLSAVLEVQGRYQEAEEINRRALNRLETKLGPDHVECHRKRSQIALLLQLQGSYFEAEAMYLPSLVGLESALGIEHPDTLKCMSNLASLYGKQERWIEAKDLGEQVTELREMVMQAESPTLSDDDVNAQPVNTGTPSNVANTSLEKSKTGDGSQTLDPLESIEQPQ